MMLKIDYDGERVRMIVDAPLDEFKAIFGGIIALPDTVTYREKPA